eukprot:3685707-Rhodomonas_salina.1
MHTQVPGHPGGEGTPTRRVGGSRLRGLQGGGGGWGSDRGPGRGWGWGGAGAGVGQTSRFS